MIFYMQISMKACCKLILRFFWWAWSSNPNIPKIANFQCLYTISKKKLVIMLIFWMQINIKVSTSWFQHSGHKSFLKLTGMIKKTWRTWRWAWPSILKVLKVTSLPYLCNISKMKLGMELKLPQVRLSFFDASSQTFQNYPKKGARNCFCVLLWRKTVRNLTAF